MKTNPNDQYEQSFQFKLQLNGEQVLVFSKPGLPDWDQLLPSTTLLANLPTLQSTDHVLLFGCHHGAGAITLARKLEKGYLTITDHNFIALEMTRRTLAANQIKPVDFLFEVEIPKEYYHKYNSVYIQSPKGRNLSRRWFLQAHQALTDGGNLIIAGSNKSGIQSIIKDAVDLFGQGHILGYKKGSRVYQISNITKNLRFPTWTDTPGIAPGSWVEFTITLTDINVRIRSLPGVFSFDHLDAGTALLINAINIPAGARVLDVGCGYGIVGAYAASKGAAWVDMIDNDLLAVASSTETLKLNQIINASVYPGDLLNDVLDTKYDLILSNPPFHAGQKVDYQIAIALIRQSFQALNKGGQLVIVANKFIRYDRLIDETFSNITCLAETGKYHVLSGIKTK